jgi:hypothetical protein
MSALPSAHLTADDLDAFLVNAASPAAIEHVAFCDVCRSVMQTDKVLVAALHGLPALAPSGLFADRVMARVQLAVPAPVVAPLPWPRRLVADRRLRAAAVVTLTAMGASAAWTAGNRELFDSWTQQVWQDGGQWVVGSLEALAAAVARQPWYAAASEVFASPVRAGGVIAALVGVWAGGVLALRRLVMIPAGPVPDARW